MSNIFIAKNGHVLSKEDKFFIFCIIIVIYYGSKYQQLQWRKQLKYKNSTESMQIPMMQCTCDMLINTVAT